MVLNTSIPLPNSYVESVDKGQCIIAAYMFICVAKSLTEASQPLDIRQGSVSYNSV